LPLDHRIIKSRRWDSNPQSPRYEGGARPVEHRRPIGAASAGVEPARPRFKASVPSRGPGRKKRQSQRRDSNPHAPLYKRGARPVELHWHADFVQRKERASNPQGSSLTRVQAGRRRQSACPSIIQSRSRNREGPGRLRIPACSSRTFFGHNLPTGGSDVSGGRRLLHLSPKNREASGGAGGVSTTSSSTSGAKDSLCR
jgi:hypothetical protein